MRADAAFADELIGRAILAARSDAVVASDREGLIRFWSPGAERIFDHSAAEALGESLDLIIPERLRARHWEGYRHVMARARSRYSDSDPAVCARPTKGWVAAVGRVHHHADPVRGRRHRRHRRGDPQCHGTVPRNEGAPATASGAYAPGSGALEGTTPLAPAPRERGAGHAAPSAHAGPQALKSRRQFRTPP